MIELREDLRIRDPETRVIASLFRMSARRWGAPRIQDKNKDSEIVLDIGQHELAEFCNVSRSLLTRLLGDLKRQGVIEQGYGSIRVLDVSALELRLNERT